MIARPHPNAPEFTIQPATAEHAPLIQQLIQEVDISPKGLEWPRFLVAISPAGEFIGCGQIKPHADGTQELASIAVKPAWRGRGVARALIEKLLASQSGHLYLITMSSLSSFYEKFGFMPIGLDEMPAYFRRASQLPGMIAEFSRVGERPLVMRRSAAK
jgi:N-acetylglutamate synthase-like GNAT family acetyltransferase